MPHVPHEIVVPRWQELPSGLLIPSSVADRIQTDRERDPARLPAELREEPQPVAVVDAMPVSADQLAGAVNEEELGLDPSTLEELAATVRLLPFEHSRPLNLAYEPTEWDLRSTISAYFSTSTVVSGADADLRDGDPDATQWLVYLLKNGLYNTRSVMVNEFTRARELFAVLAPQLVDYPDFCPLDEWFAADYGLTPAEQHAAGFAAYVLSAALNEDAQPGERSLTVPPEWRGDLEAKAEEANDLLSAPREWYQAEFAELGDDLNTIAWERRPLLRRPFLRLEDGQWLLIAPRMIESWLGEGFLHRALQAAEQRGESLRLRGFLGALVERYCLDLTRSVYPGERPVGGGRVHGEQPYNRGSRQLTSDVAIDLGPDLVMIEVVARRLTQQMQVFGDRELLERNLGPMLFSKMRQLGRVATDLLDGTATIPDVDIGHVERVWPVLVTAGELMQTEMLWDQIDERMPDDLQAARVQPLTVLDIGDFELLLGLVAEGHQLPSVLARKNAGLYRRLEISRFMTDELHMAPPLTTRPPVLNERWETLGAEMRAVFAFGDE